MDHATLGSDDEGIFFKTAVAFDYSHVSAAQSLKLIILDSGEHVTFDRVSKIIKTFRMCHILEWVVPKEDLTITGDSAQVCLLCIVACIVDNPNDPVDRLSVEVLISLRLTEETTLNLIL